MAEHIVERRVQLRGRSFVLTIPKDIAAEMGLCRGQGVRFTLKDGALTVRPTGVAGPNPDGGRYEEAIANMMRGAAPETSAGARQLPGIGTGEPYVRRP